MSTWSSCGCFEWPQVRCGGICSTWRIGRRHGSFRVYSTQQDVFDFGKHSGKHDNGYLVNNFSESDPWCKAAADALTRRGKMKRQQSATRNVHVHNLLSDLKSCTTKKDLQKGRQVHAKAVETGIASNMYVAATLINMYAKCGSMAEARTVFDGIHEPDVVSWNALMLGYADNGQGLIALDLLSTMKHAPNSVTYVAALKACTSLAADGDETTKKRCLERGREIHLEIGCHMDHFLQNTLIDMYAKCGSVADARSVFDSIQEPNVVSWTAVILGYGDNGQGLVALDLFARMKDHCRSAPNSMTYVAALKACTSLAADRDEPGRKACLERGKEIHLEIGCYMNQFVQNTLINMYAKCGSMMDARGVFDSIQEPNVVSWNALILGYAENGQALVGLDLFSRMKDECRSAPNSVTYVAALKACTSLAADGDETGKIGCLERGREIHSKIGSHMNRFLQVTLIDMYAKCGSIVDARAVFDGIQEPNVVSWNAMMLGYADNGQGLVALDLFSRMKDECRSAPNSVTYFAALKACGSNGALAIGRRLHSEIRELDARVVTSLVDFYAKCGSMEEAREVFDLHPETRDVSTWNALLAGYGRFGNTGSVFSLFKAMQDQGFRPNAVTFLCILGCCSHAGLVEKAWEYLDVMPTRYGLAPTVMHYTCMVDLLGRVNKLDEAVVLLQKMPCIPDAVTWMTLLGACRKWENVEIGRIAFKSLVDLDQKEASAYILMAEIYGSKSMWEEQDRVLETGMRSGASKLPGQGYVLDGLARINLWLGRRTLQMLKSEDKLKESRRQARTWICC